MRVLIKSSLLDNFFENLLHCKSYSLIFCFQCSRKVSVILFFFPLIFIFYAYGDELYTIDKTTLQKDEFGYLHLFGEIKNNSDKTITNITLSSQFLDSSENIIGTFTRSSEINTLNPNQSSPFEIIYLEPTTSEKVENYLLSVEYKAGKEKPRLLYINNTNDRLDFTGLYYINGEITNKGTITANNVTVVATLYDKDNKIIGITKAITEPFVIEPKDKAAFGLAVNNKANALKINDFSLQAYSDSYLSNIFNSSK